MKIENRTTEGVMRTVEEQDHPDYMAVRDGGRPDHTVTVDGEEVPHVFEFCVSEGWVRAYSVSNLCPACGHEGAEKHLRWWGGPTIRVWESEDGRAWPKHPDPSPCWFEMCGVVRVWSDGEDVTDEYDRSAAA